MAMPGTINGPDSENESVSVNVRKIDNGYVISESRCKGSDYTYNERFTAEKPDIASPVPKPMAPSAPDSMAKAVSLLNSATGNNKKGR